MTFINNVQAEKSLYIAGEWQSGMDTIANINPSDISENIGDFSQASVSQVEQAIQAAKSAQPEWEKHQSSANKQCCKRLVMSSLHDVTNWEPCFRVKKVSHLLKVEVRFTVLANSSNTLLLRFCVKLAITLLPSVQVSPLKLLVKPSALSPLSLLGTFQQQQLLGKSRQHLRLATASSGSLPTNPSKCRRADRDYPSPRFTCWHV